MDYYASFAIAASGMAVQKTRLDIAALNLANASSTRAGGALYQPQTVISGPRAAGRFEHLLAGQAAALPALGAQVVSVQPLNLPPRLVHEPGHPDADARGFVSYPAVDTLREMLTLITATRAYEANLSALNAARSMAQRALEIGGNT
jgi:flagellar basal-body rod protein FlgC